ncbi:hypothetical protein FIBSPDRAFT_894217 [Athelia psychrophila]|uniref:Uncharacterized protein n=1 Tax=Athelia psychrophila TaxID=1759441 RepID=A0A166G4S6_9AGAM|nr:hypothetical protein FIBSPDRAFT_894217 [Fibularhizoctonia sp. CBS 109695]
MWREWRIGRSRLMLKRGQVEQRHEISAPRSLTSPAPLQAHTPSRCPLLAAGAPPYVLGAWCMTAHDPDKHIASVALRPLLRILKQGRGTCCHFYVAALNTTPRAAGEEKDGEESEEGETDRNGFTRGRSRGSWVHTIPHLTSQYTTVLFRSILSCTGGAVVTQNFSQKDTTYEANQSCEVRGKDRARVNRRNGSRQRARHVATNNC